MKKKPKIGRPEDTSVPSCDDEEPVVSCYPDWTSETTRVVRVDKPMFPTWKAARRHFQAKFGRVFENLSTVRHWAARVKR